AVGPDARARLQRKSSAFSGIIGPDGRVVGEPLIDDEGIVYAEIDLERCIQPKQMHDIVGHYNRFDVFDLRVNRRPLAPLDFAGGESAEQGSFTPIPLRSEA
ncbi:MAG: carbon-nitrogen hydrolase family protein, partial [Bradyrhizobium guangdongense]